MRCVLCLECASPSPSTWRTPPHPRPSSIVSISEACPASSRQNQSLFTVPPWCLAAVFVGVASNRLWAPRGQGPGLVFILLFFIVFVYIVQSLAHGRYLINVCFMFIWLNIHLIPEVYSGHKCLLNTSIYHRLFWKYLSLSLFSEAFNLNFGGQGLIFASDFISVK